MCCGLIVTLVLSPVAKIIQVSNDGSVGGGGGCREANFKWCIMLRIISVRYRLKAIAVVTDRRWRRRDRSRWCRGSWCRRYRNRCRRSRCRSFFLTRVSWLIGDLYYRVTTIIENPKLIPISVHAMQPRKKLTSPPYLQWTHIEWSTPTGNGKLNILTTMRQSPYRPGIV